MSNITILLPETLLILALASLPLVFMIPNRRRSVPRWSRISWA